MRAGSLTSTSMRREPRSPVLVLMSAIAWVAVGGWANPVKRERPPLGGRPAQRRDELAGRHHGREQLRREAGAHLGLGECGRAVVESGQRPGDLLPDRRGGDPRHRRAQCVTGVDPPFGTDRGEREPRALRFREPRGGGVAVDIDVHRAVGGAPERVGSEPGQALLQRRLAPVALGAAGELGARRGGVAVGQRLEIAGRCLADLLLVGRRTDSAAARSGNDEREQRGGQHAALRARGSVSGHVCPLTGWFRRHGCTSARHRRPGARPSRRRSARSRW